MKLTKFQGLMLIVSETGMEAGQPDEGRSARGRRVMWVICSLHGSHCQTTFNSASISLRFSTIPHSQRLIVPIFPLTKFAGSQDCQLMWGQ